MSEASVKHLRKALGIIQETDELLIACLDDCPQDLITLAAGELLGLSKLETLSDSAEEDGDLWKLARRAILAGCIAGRQANVQARWKHFRRGLDACEKIGTQEISDKQCQERETLELVTLSLLSNASDPQDAARIPRMLALIDQEHLDKCVVGVSSLTLARLLNLRILMHCREPVHKAMCQIFVSVMTGFGDHSKYPEMFAKVAVLLSNGARNHPDQRMRSSVKLLMTSLVMAQPCYSLPWWDWDKLYLDDDGTT
eukprot:COSAG01_NODE_19012_length_1037_cov_1.124733_2_plen_254_part_01